MIIETLEQLRALYPAPKERVVKKQLSALDAHCRRFIALSPLVVVASCGAAAADASPRGGAPGFVRIVDERTLLIPDAPGNNRLDTLENLIASRRIGLLFMIPGVEESLRVNGSARLSCDAAQLQLFAAEKRPPKLLIEVAIAEAYLHCPKAMMRASLWQASAQIDCTTLPTLVEVINDQTGIVAPVLPREEMRANFAADL